MNDSTRHDDAPTAQIPTDTESSGSSSTRRSPVSVTPPLLVAGVAASVVLGGLGGVAIASGAEHGGDSHGPGQGRPPAIGFAPGQGTSGSRGPSGRLPRSAPGGQRLGQPPQGLPPGGMTGVPPGGMRAPSGRTTPPSTEGTGPRSTTRTDRSGSRSI